MGQIREGALARAWSSAASRCGCCKRKRDTFRINKRAGGSYNRAQRRYHASICAECALEMVPYAGTHAMATTSGYDVSTLVATPPPSTRRGTRDRRGLQDPMAEGPAMILRFQEWVTRNLDPATGAVVMAAVALVPAIFVVLLVVAVSER